MPSMEAPQYYDRSKAIMGSEFDPFFRYVSPDYYEADTGTTDSPIGWVGLLRVDASTAAAVKADYTWPIDAPEEGWYIVRINDQGLVWGISYGGTDTFSEELARADFAEAERTYTRWMDLTDEYTI